MTEATAVGRPALVRRGLLLNYLTIEYNTLEAIVSLAVGLLAGSVAPVGFGVDSVIEATASAAAQWRLQADLDPVRRARVERVAHRVIGVSFVALTAHLIKPEAGNEDEVLAYICRDLHDRFGIEHTALQVERGDSAPCALAPDHVV